MYIGEVAKTCGVSPKTIRHYESLGLLGVVQRTGAYRTYGRRDIGVVNLIRHGQSLGFKLSEMDFLNAADPDWTRLERMIEFKQRDIAAEITRLQQLSVALAGVMDEIRACPDLGSGMIGAC